eukprot:364918-Chlamydomonas_euryale.AAC.8
MAAHACTHGQSVGRPGELAGSLCGREGEGRRRGGRGCLVDVAVKRRRRCRGHARMWRAPSAWPWM